MSFRSNTITWQFVHALLIACVLSETEKFGGFQWGYPKMDGFLGKSIYGWWLGVPLRKPKQIWTWWFKIHTAIAGDDPGDWTEKWDPSFPHVPLGLYHQWPNKKTSANPLVSLGDMIWILVLTILCFFLESNQWLMEKIRTSRDGNIFWGSDGDRIWIVYQTTIKSTAPYVEWFGRWNQMKSYDFIWFHMWFHI